MKHKRSSCILSFIHLCTHRDKTVKENLLKTEADRRQRKMSLPGKVGEMSHAVEVCVYVPADCELIRCLLIPYLSHLYFLAPFNPSSRIPAPSSHSRCKFLCIFLNIYCLFPRPLVLNLSLGIFRPALFLSLCSERQKMVSFALSTCHSSLVPLSLKLFDSITISI